MATSRLEKLFFVWRCRGGLLGLVRQRRSCPPAAVMMGGHAAGWEWMAHARLSNPLLGDWRVTFIYKAAARSRKLIGYLQSCSEKVHSEATKQQRATWRLLPTQQLHLFFTTPSPVPIIPKRPNCASTSPRQRPLFPDTHLRVIGVSYYLS